MSINCTAVSVAICALCAHWVRRGTVFFGFVFLVYLFTVWDSPARSSTTWSHCKQLQLDVDAVLCFGSLFPVLLVNWPYVHEVVGNDHWLASMEYGSRALTFHMGVKWWSFLSSKERTVVIWMNARLAKVRDEGIVGIIAPDLHLYMVPESFILYSLYTRLLQESERESLCIEFSVVYNHE